MDKEKTKIANEIFEASQDIINEYELEADMIINKLKKKPWHKYFTSVELVLVFFGAALIYIVLNIIYFEFLKKIM